MTAEIRFGRYQDALADITCDTVIVDAPYGARVHNADGARADGARADGLALDAHARGRRRLGIGFLAELARWNLTTDAHDGEGFKVNSDYRAIWVRRLIVECPELAGMFETRARRAA